MTIEKTRIRIGADDRGARGVARRVKRDMDGIEREAKQAERAVGRARRHVGSGSPGGLRGRFAGLLQRRGIQMRTEDVTLGNKFKFGRSGFSLRSSYVQGGAGTGLSTVLGGAFAAGWAAQGAANIFDTVGDARDYIDQNPDASLLTRIAYMGGKKASGGLATAITENPFTQLVKAWGRAFRANSFKGMDAGEIDLYVNHSWDRWLRGESELDRQIEAGGRRVAALREQARILHERDSAKEAAKEKARNDAYQKLDDMLEHKFEGLKSSVFRPKDSRFPRRLNAIYERKFNLWKQRRRDYLERTKQAEIEERVNNNEGR